MTESQKRMFEELDSKDIFEQAKDYAYQYLKDSEDMPVFPSQASLEKLKVFEESMPAKGAEAQEILSLLHKYGTENTIASTRGRYFGFVTGGAIPVSLAVKWLTDVWDQCGGLYLISPINAAIESICEKWLVDLFGLPQNTVAGFVSGTSMANICGLAAARFRILKNLGWDINKQGLNGAPQVKVYCHDQSHACITKALAILGFGTANITTLKSDEEGKLMDDSVPELDSSSILVLQAGNVNTGAFDQFDPICKKARMAGAWVHIDGAFGLWAACAQSTKSLTDGYQYANSWAVDGHKTLNTPYDSGIILCDDKEALVSALQSSGSYIKYSEHRDSMLYTPEMSKRSRAFELWAILKYLGSEGVDQLVDTLVKHTQSLAKSLQSIGYEVHNKVYFNQLMVSGKDDAETQRILEHIQASGDCWCGPSSWNGRMVIRISVCSWVTTEEDLKVTVEAFRRAMF